MSSSRITDRMILSLDNMVQLLATIRPRLEQETALMLGLIDDYDSVTNRDLEEWVDDVKDAVLHFREASSDLFYLERH